MKKEYIYPTLEVIALNTQRCVLLSLSNGEAQEGNENETVNFAPGMSGSDEADW